MPVRTLIVDDSASIRAALARILSADPEIEVVGQAPEPNTARQMIKDLEPDVITLDVEMPGMDGLSFLERIMRLRPMPVVMCSTLTARGAAVTIEALRLGAVDYIAKPSGNAEELMRDAALLRQKVKAAARSTVRATSSATPGTAAMPARATENMVIAVGASTGGVEALFTLLAAMPVNCPPIVIVQHMPGAFTGSFADRLDRTCRIAVKEAQDGQPIVAGTAYIAPGGDRHMELVGGTSANGCIRLRAGELVSGHRPSVDVLFHSAAKRGPGAVGVILTGMGSDGADGLLAMRAAGAHTFGQSRESCVIYGMPRAAFELGAVEREKGLAALPEAILAACSDLTRVH
jgi:two-component system chemotaxis response regulator CheB